MSSFGLDYVTGPPIADMKAAGVSFVCRYLSYVNSLTQVKLLTPGEAKALSAAGIAIVSNYEWYANRALEGTASGVQDGQIAASQHTACGGPANRPIYFSVDVDCEGSQVAPYFQGVAKTIGLHRTAGYGSYRVLKYLFDNGLITWGWQTYAWSYGAWEPRAHIQQYQNGVSMSGHSVDYNRSIKSDFGQWRIGGQPMSGVPQGWHDDGTVLYSPGSVAGGPEVHITGPFRDYILANSWPNANVAVEVGHHVDQLELSNTNLGSGWQQTFRYAMLGKPDTGSMAGKVVFEWLGTELAHVRNLYAQAQTQIATLQQELAQAQKAPPTVTGVDQAKVASRLQAIGLASHNGDAAIQSLVASPL
ncbi:MAG TPA: DUF1906 domain-containing protein [Ktedonobacteraceae bacterium]|nr:DUF1906 domain-containing protein [Ktedonobacteraceae bacterium]